MQLVHQEALEALLGEPLTLDQVQALEPYLADPEDRNDVKVAAILSAGRKRFVPTEIGSGTILAKLGDGGGEFLDALVQLSAANRNVYWTLDLIKQGRFRIDLPESREQMEDLATATAGSLPAISAGLHALLDLGQVDDPIPVDAVSRVLNIAEGRMIL